MPLTQDDLVLIQNALQPSFDKLKSELKSELTSELKSVLLSEFRRELRSEFGKIKDEIKRLDDKIENSFREIVAEIYDETIGRVKRIESKLHKTGTILVT